MGHEACHFPQKNGVSFSGAALTFEGVLTHRYTTCAEQGHRCA